MVAPIDAKAELIAGDETFTLTLNWRTIALAEAEQRDVLTTMGDRPSLSGLALVIWAFAQPAHPALTLDEALALAMRHGEAAGAALTKLLALGGVKGDGSAHPRKRSGATAAS